jgi:hypothetical protein
VKKNRNGIASSLKYNTNQLKIFKKKRFLWRNRNRIALLQIELHLLFYQQKLQGNFMLWLIKDKVLLTVGCPIFLSFYNDSQISVHRKFKKIDQLIFRNAKEIYFNEKFPIYDDPYTLLSFILNEFCSRFVMAVPFISALPSRVS